jgi:hypothetical protein
MRLQLLIGKDDSRGPHEAIVRNGVPRRKRNLLAARLSGARRPQSLVFVLAPAIVALAMFTMPAGAQEGTTVSDAAGGTGGGPFRVSCPSGMVMIGINGRHGAWVDAVAPLCAIWTNGALVPIEFQPGTGGAGGGHGWMLCRGPRGAVVGLWVWPVRRDNRRLIGRIVLECGDYELPARRVNKRPGGADGFGQTAEGERVPLRCGPREVAVGLYGRSGAFVDRVGLLCERSRAVAP